MPMLEGNGSIGLGPTGVFESMILVHRLKHREHELCVWYFFKRMSREPSEVTVTICIAELASRRLGMIH